MILNVVLLTCVCTVSAFFEISNIWTESFGRQSRDVPPSPFEQSSLSCDELSNTETTAFVVLILERTSGRFLGMGSLIDKKTVLTAALVLKDSMSDPYSILVLAGRLNPWWGKESQVRHAKDMYIIDGALGMITLKGEFNYAKNVQPVRVLLESPKSIADSYGNTFAVFGIPRSSWDVPGEEISKTIVYNMKLESMPAAPTECEHVYPDFDFNATTMICTFANGSWNWGSLGSPTLAVDKATNDLIQVAVVVKTTSRDADKYHFHLVLPFYEQWIRSHSLLGYQKT